MPDIDPQSYNVGYRDGENNVHADWHGALDDYVTLPEGFDVNPVSICNYIERLQTALIEIRDMDYRGNRHPSHDIARKALEAP